MSKIATIAAVVLMSWSALAQSSAYCLSTSDGRFRIPKTGSCPSGYHSVDGGRCCESFKQDARQAFPKEPGKACPSGTYASGGACLAFR